MMDNLEQEKFLLEIQDWWSLGQEEKTVSPIHTNIVPSNQEQSINSSNNKDAD